MSETRYYIIWLLDKQDRRNHTLVILDLLPHQQNDGDHIAGRLAEGAMKVGADHVLGWADITPYVLWLHQSLSEAEATAAVFAHLPAPPRPHLN